MHEPDHQFIYIISCGSYRKIGRATKPLARLSSIQSGNPYKCSLEYARPLLDRFVIEAEAAIHDELLEQRVRGEWFHCSKEDAIGAVGRGCRRAIDERLHSEGFFHKMWGDQYDEIFGEFSIPDPRQPRSAPAGG